MTTACSAPTLDRLVTALNGELQIEKFPGDPSNNGLQVACSAKPVRTICCGVDASMEFFEEAAGCNADLLICHHGLSWGDSLKYITGLNYRHLQFLLQNDMALWACHLPLDAHMELGNNAGLANEIGLNRLEPFGNYHGTEIGVSGVFPEAVSSDDLTQKLRRALGEHVKLWPFGKNLIRTVGIISGGAADYVDQAADAGLDAYISGEPSLVGYNLARQLDITAFMCGHYATERFGVQAVGRWLEEHFDVSVSFIDLAIPY